MKIKGKEIAKQRLMQNAEPILVKGFNGFVEDPEDLKEEYD